MPTQDTIIHENFGKFEEYVKSLEKENEHSQYQETSSPLVDENMTRAERRRIEKSFKKLLKKKSPTLI